MYKLIVSIQKSTESAKQYLLTGLGISLQSIVELNKDGKKILEIYFGKKTQATSAARKLKKFQPDLDCLCLPADTPHDDNRSDSFKAFEILNQWSVVPARDARRDFQMRKNTLYLASGKSFGIGSHPTTQLCAEWIRKSAAESESFLDIGSGSGVLLLLASRLGIEKAHGVEPDPDSYKISLKNIRINKAANCKVARKMIKKISSKQLRYDLVCANLESRLLEEYCDEIISWVRPDGKLILSGMIRKNRKSVLDLYRSRGFRLCGSRTSGEWCSVVLRGGKT